MAKEDWNNEATLWLTGRYTIEMKITRKNAKGSSSADTVVESKRFEDQNYASYLAASEGIGIVEGMIREAWADALPQVDPEAAESVKGMVRQMHAAAPTPRPPAPKV